MANPFGPNLTDKEIAALPIRMKDGQPVAYHRTLGGVQCRHVATISPKPLLHKFGEHQRLVQLEDRFRCTECDHRGGNSARVFRLDRNV